MKLIIVESPTKAKTIEKFLGKGFKVLSSYGHVRDLPKNNLGIDIENNFEPKYVVFSKAKKTIQSLKKEVKKSDSVILATDEDREGEAIAWHLVEALKLDKNKNCQRIVFHEITKPAIEEALKNPRDINMSQVDAQQARRILDRLVGYKLSPFLWKKIVKGLSAGRVQSIAVRLVAEKEKEIENFVPEEYWNIIATLHKIKDNENEFEANLVKINGKSVPKMGIKVKEEADEIIKNLKGAEYKIIGIKKKETKKNPLPPFTTSTLQQEAWKKLGWTAKFTMGNAQKLYEKGLITYHRSDSLNLSDISLAAAKKFIAENYGKNYYQFRKFKTRSKSAQEAHEAIRPSYPDKTPETVKGKVEEKHLKLYDLIWRRFVASQMNQAIFNSTKADIEAGEYLFRASGQILKFDGFLKVYPMKHEETELPDLKENEILELIKLISSQHFTKPPARYTEATLIKELEKNGIGRPSTYAPVISTIQSRNYIEKNEQKRFQPTEIGILTNNLLVEHFPKIVDIEFTAKMEEDLDKISQGKTEWREKIKEFYFPFAENLAKKEKEVSKEKTGAETDKKCPECQSPILIKLGRFGKFYACSAFPKCRYSAPLKKKNLGVKCPKCQEGDLVEKTTKRKKIFYACDRFPKCDFALWDKPVKNSEGKEFGEKCPECQSLLVEKGKNIHPVKSDQVGISPKAKLFNRVKCSQKECSFVQ